MRCDEKSAVRDGYDRLLTGLGRLLPPKRKAACGLLGDAQDNIRAYKSVTDSLYSGRKSVFIRAIYGSQLACFTPI